MNTCSNELISLTC